MLPYKRSVLPSSKPNAMEGDKAILPHDIIVQILKRLPVKSLIRFQCVCKLWKNLIKTPSLIPNHLHHSAHNNPFLLLHASHCRHNFPPLYLIDSKMETVEVHNPSLIDSLRHVRTVIGSCNGLLCVELCYDDGRYPSLLLWNPAIREVKQVPRTKNDYLGICRAGFGFNSIVNDYKIVRFYNPKFYDKNKELVSMDKIYLNRVEVYLLSTGSWKEVEFGVVQSVRVSPKAVIVNGTMFWIGLRAVDDRHMVISFDLAMEVFTLIQIPASTSKSVNTKLIVYENKLAMFHGHHVVENSESTSIDLWVMEEDAGSWSWTKKYAIAPISGMLFPKTIWKNEIYCCLSEKFKFIDENESGNEVECYGRRGFLSSVNLITNELKILCRHHYDDHDIFNYVESLVPVGNIHIE